MNRRTGWGVAGTERLRHLMGREPCTSPARVTLCPRPSLHPLPCTPSLRPLPCTPQKPCTLPRLGRFHPPEMDHTVHHKAGFAPQELTAYLHGARALAGAGGWWPRRGQHSLLASSACSCAAPRAAAHRQAARPRLRCAGAGLEGAACRVVGSFTKPRGDDPQQQMPYELLMASARRPAA